MMSPDRYEALRMQIKAVFAKIDENLVDSEALTIQCKVASDALNKARFASLEAYEQAWQKYDQANSAWLANHEQWKALNAHLDSLQRQIEASPC